MRTSLIYIILFLGTYVFGAENVWTPVSGFYWHNKSNWSLGHVPTASEDVYIPAGLAYLQLPLVTIDTAVCKKLESYSGLRMSGTLTVYGDFIVGGGEVDFADGSVLIVNDDIFWLAGATTDYVHSVGHAEIHVYDDWTFGVSSNLDLEDIHVYMEGTNPAWIYAKALHSEFKWLYLLKDNSTVEFGSASTYPLEVERLYNGDATHTQCTFVSNSSQDIIINTWLTNEAKMHLNAGTIEFHFGTTVDFNSGDYFNHVEFHVPPAYGVTFTGEAWVKGDLTTYLSGGSVFIDILRIEGDFDNSDGTLMALGYVKCTGSQIQNFYSVNCDTLELDKSGGELRFPSHATSCNVFDWTEGLYRVNGGTFSIYDLLDPGLFGTISVTSGLHLITQDAFQFIDLRGTLFITGGTMRVMGGSDDSYWPYNDNASLTMHGGILDIFDQGIYINNTGNLITNISGGTIQTQGEFRCLRTDFDPTGGKLLLYGSLPGQTSVRLQCVPGANLFDVEFGKGSISVHIDTDLEVDGDFIIPSGIVFSDNHDINVAGDWYSGGAFIKGISEVTFDGNGIQEISGVESFHTLILNNTGGEMYFSSTASVSCDTFNHESGTVHVSDGWFIADELADYGIYGSYIIENNGIVYLYQGSGPTDGVHLNGFISMSSGVFRVYGGNGPSHWANFLNAGLTMSGGQLWFQDQGIIIDNSHGFTENISSGVIGSAGDFICYRSDFQPTGGTVIINSNLDADIQMQSGGYFYDLTIDLSPGHTLTALSDLTIQDDLFLSSGIFDAKHLDIGGDWTNLVGETAFEEGTFTVTFFNNLSSVLQTNETFYNVEINKSGSTSNSFLYVSDGDTMSILNNLNIADGAIELENSSKLFVSGDIHIAAGSGLNANFDTGLEIEVGGNWTNANSTFGTWHGFWPGSCKVTFDGYGDQTIDCHAPAGDFYDLIIENHDYYVYITNPLYVLNDLTLIKGTTHAPDTIRVGGNWANYGGSGSFDEGSGQVIFQGPVPSDILTNETFYDLTQEKTYSGFDGLDLAPGITVNVLGDLLVYTGTVEMNTNSTLDIEGDLTITANAGLNADGDTGLDIYIGGDWTDHNTAWSNKIGFSPGTSRVTFDGPDDNQAVYCNATDADFYDIVISKSSDSISQDFVTFLTNMKILDDCVVHDGRWYDLLGGGYTHEFYNKLEIKSGAGWYGGNSTVVFKSPSVQKWIPSPVFSDNFFFNVTIDSPSGTVILYNDVQSINGGFLSVASGTLNLNGWDFYVGGDAEILATGTVVNQLGGELRIGNDPY